MPSPKRRDRARDSLDVTLDWGLFITQSFVTRRRAGSWSPGLGHLSASHQEKAPPGLVRGQCGGWETWTGRDCRVLTPTQEGGISFHTRGHRG